MITNETYLIAAALAEDVNNGHVWIQHKYITMRQVVKISNVSNKKKIICDAIPLTDNFRHKYCSDSRRVNIKKEINTIVISEWYRMKLGISTKNNVNLKIIPVKNAYASFRASFSHPQAIVRQAAILSLISVILGIVGVVLGTCGVLC